MHHMQSPGRERSTPIRGCGCAPRKMLIISGMNEANYSCLFLDYKMYLGVNGS